MKQLTVLFALVAFATMLGGCGVGKMATSKEFWVYGYCEDATLVIRNDVPHSAKIVVGGDPTTYMIPPDATLTIPGRYPVFSQTHRRIPVTASMMPFEPAVRSATMVWNFHNNGHSLNTGQLVQGREVHAILELQNLDPKAKTNRLIFRVGQ
ncbi:MAG: hypothetical protein V1885_02790 [Candidatus Brennerbacteria bacterium]